MPYQKQNTSTFRQFDIIKRLYALEVLQGSLVATQYNVTARTLLRDMKKISKVIPLLNKNGKWSLDLQILNTYDTNTLNHTLLQSFAKNIDITFSCLEKSTLNASKISFAMNYNKLPKVLGSIIVDALQQERQCSFVYVKKEGTSQRTIDPIKLYTQDERWYLIARDYKDDRVKSFLLSKMQRFQIIKNSTTLVQSMLEEAEKIINSVWHSTNSSIYSVKLYVKPVIADYVEEKALHKTQVIVDRHYDGGLEVHCNITNKLEILPVLKNWLPHIHIIEPKWLREELIRDLEYYRDEDLKMDI